MEAALGERGLAAEDSVGLEDRDWYWNRRKARASPDDEYLFPGQRWPDGKRARIVALVAAGALLAMLAVVFLPTVFDRAFAPSKADRIAAERRALGQSGASRPVERSPARDATSRRTPAQQHRADSLRQVVVIAGAGLALLSPLVLIGLLGALLFRGARGPAAAGLAFGIIAATVGPLTIRPLFPGEIWLVVISLFSFFSAGALGAAIVAIIVRPRREAAARAAPAAEPSPPDGPASGPSSTRTDFPSGRLLALAVVVIASAGAIVAVQRRHAAAFPGNRQEAKIEQASNSAEPQVKIAPPVPYATRPPSKVADRPRYPGQVPPEGKDGILPIASLDNEFFDSIDIAGEPHRRVTMYFIRQSDAPFMAAGRIVVLVKSRWEFDCELRRGYRSDARGFDESAREVFHLPEQPFKPFQPIAPGTYDEVLMKVACSREWIPASVKAAATPPPSVSLSSPYGENDWRLVPLSVPRSQGPVYLDMKTILRIPSKVRAEPVISAIYQLVNDPPLPNERNELVEHVDIWADFDCATGTSRRKLTLDYGLARIVLQRSYRTEDSSWQDASALETFAPVAPGSPEQSVLRLLCR
jgi:hypothetical protein